MGEITLIEMIIAVIFIGGIVFGAVFSVKVDMLESRVDFLEKLLWGIQKDTRKNNDGRNDQQTSGD